MIMLARLGDFLRHALESSHAVVDVATSSPPRGVPRVQQTRFSDRLSISIDASPESLASTCHRSCCSRSRERD